MRFTHTHVYGRKFFIYFLKQQYPLIYERGA
uniref:Uncharacterized protein n=1 Tax=Anguilla anguilla TaxID=7936 RepID=A0A0E9PAU1_ANGAN